MPKSGSEATMAILAERRETHGDYGVHAAITQRLKYVINDTDHEPQMGPAQREALDMIAHKIGRILAGNPYFEDHWRDIAGYATLVADILAKVNP